MLAQLNVAHMLSIIFIQGHSTVALMVMDIVPSWESTYKPRCPRGESIHRHQRSDPFCTNLLFELV